MLTDEQVATVRELLQAKHSQRKVAKLSGVCRAKVQQIASGNYHPRPRKTDSAGSLKAGSITRFLLTAADILAQADKPCGVDLRGEQLTRYEAIRSTKARPDD